jgi:hypothetical protein
MDLERGRPVLIEFWDFCRPNSLRTLPYIKAWHARYADAGLRVVQVHCSGFAPSESAAAVRDAVPRLGIEHPVLIDNAFALWQTYGTEGWPSRYLWSAEGVLVGHHAGEGDYADTELAIGRELGIPIEPLPPLKPEDAPDARLARPSPDRLEAPWSGPYEAGGVWAVLEGSGTAVVNGRELAISHPGAYPLIEHPRHTAGLLDLGLQGHVTCHAICFTPGLSD